MNRFDTMITKLVRQQEIFLDVSAGWVYLPSVKGGFLTEESLRAIADFLEERNKELFNLPS